LDKKLDAYLIFGHPVAGGHANPKPQISCHKNNTCPCRKVSTAIWKTIFVFRDNFKITKFVNYTHVLVTFRAYSFLMAGIVIEADPDSSVQRNFVYRGSWLDGQDLSLIIK
jgi:hypothetical protein